MKKTIILLLSFLLCLNCVLAARAEMGVNVEVLKIDGVSVVVFTLDEIELQARGAEEKGAGFTLPGMLTQIGEEAFYGIAAETIEVTENVVSIGPRAFADCKNLREITIPANVTAIDDSALSGCENVTVYGVKGTEAERFANENGFAFAQIGGETPEEPFVVREAPPVQLPLVPR